jgi:polar amino acid transport system substrate-binding protein
MKTKVLMALGLAAVTVLGFGLSSAQDAMAASKYGNCVVTGKMGDPAKFTPAVAGQLTVEVNLPAPGWYNGDTPELIKDGTEYCLAANIAHRLGLEKVVVKNVAWDGLVAGQTSDFDLALSQISITKERQKVVEFSTPYFTSDAGVMVKKGKKIDEKSIKGLRWGVQQGTTGESFATKTLKIKKVKVFPDTPSMFAALQAGQIDLAMTDTSILMAQAKQSNGKFEVVAQYKTGEAYGALFPKGNANNKTINKVIESLIKDSTVRKLVAKYMSIDPMSVKYFRP